MAHFAQIDENNLVTKVIVIDNDILLDENNNESEFNGIIFCNSLFGGDWIQTSYNRSIRKNYAAVGFTYDADLDAFIPPKCHEEALLNKDALWDCENIEHETLA